MTDLTEQWKNGKIEALEELINQITTTDDSRSLSDEYLKEKGLMTRDECGVAGEYPYGIVMVVSDYVLPYLKKLQALKEENQQLKELLKECRDYVVNTLIELKNGYCYEENDYYHETKTLLTKVDNAIGEKK